MNILYLTSTGSIIGGGEISLLNLFKKLDRQRFKPYCIVPCEGDFTDRIKALDIPVIILPIEKVKNIFNIFKSLEAIKRLKSIISQYKIDLIHCNSTRGISFLGAISAKKMKVPFVWHIRVIESAVFLDFLNSFLVSKIIFNSKITRKRFFYFPVMKKSTVIYNAVDLDKFRAVIPSREFRKKIGCKDDTIIIATIGRYHPIKGYEYFIKAAKIISQYIHEVKFLIVGLNYYDNNPYLNKLKKLAAKLGILDKIIFLQ